MKKIVVGILGAGRIGQVHTRAMSQQIGVRVKHVSDTVMTPGISKQLQYWGVESTSKIEDDIFSDEEIQAIFICSPTSTHYDYSLKAISKNKHIFCEKPVDMKLSRIEKIKKMLSKKPNLIYQVGFNRRFDHNFIAVKEAVEKKKIGMPQMIRITSRDPAPPPIEYIQSSGGLFMDMMIHDFDMIRFQTGSDVEEVYTVAAVLVDQRIGKAGDVDSAIVTLKLKNGMIGYIENCRHATYGYDQRVEILGSDGAVSIKNDTVSTKIISNKNGITEETPLHFFLERYKDAYMLEQTSFFNAINKKKPSPCGIEAGYASVKIAYAAIKSMEEHKPIKVSEIKGDM